MTGPAAETSSPPAHTPVMAAEVPLALSTKPGGSYIDCNLGEGGHTEAILKSAYSVSILGIDLDYGALSRAQDRLSRWAAQLSLHHGNFADIALIARNRRFSRCDGVLFDLGVSSAQLDDPERGFSFRYDASLDMRFDPGARLTAYDIVNRWPQSKLEWIIRELGEEPRARRVAAGIVRNRRIDTTGQLAAVVSKSLNWPIRSRRHPATRTFQALRMAVNEEISNLERGLAGAVEALSRGGRLVVISYHSVEDRIVKRFMRASAEICDCPPRLPECMCDKTPTLTLLSKGVIKPRISEIRDNPRARSARMRVAERI